MGESQLQMELDKVYTRTMRCRINIYIRFTWNVLKAMNTCLKRKITKYKKKL